MDETNGFTLEEVSDPLNGTRIKRVFYKTGEIYMEVHSRAGPNSHLFHRSPEAAVITWFKSGKLKSEEYFINGVPKRHEGGPIKVSYNFRGQLRSLTWAEHSDQVRLGGPIHVKFVGGSPIEMTWATEKHKTGGYRRTWSEGHFSWLNLESHKEEGNPYFAYLNALQRLKVTEFK